jgi:hypothetical protein
MNRRDLVLGAACASLLAAARWKAWLRAAFRSYTEESEASGSLRIPSAEPVASSAPSASVSEPPCQAPPADQPPAAAQESPPRIPSAAESLAEAAERARTERKKILVFVIPEGKNWSKIYDREHLFGEYLNHGRDLDLAPLASVIVVCARTSDVNKAFGSDLRTEPLLLVVNTAPRPARVLPLDAPLIPLEAPPDPRQEPPRQEPRQAIGAKNAPRRKTREEVANGRIDERIATVSRLVRQGLGEPAPQQAESLAGDVRQQVVVHRPLGGQWANSTGCETSYEEGPVKSPRGGSCGMGHVPRRSARFLYFLATRAG